MRLRAEQDLKRKQEQSEDCRNKNVENKKIRREWKNSPMEDRKGLGATSGAAVMDQGCATHEVRCGMEM